MSIRCPRVDRGAFAELDWEDGDGGKTRTRDLWRAALNLDRQGRQACRLLLGLTRGAPCLSGYERRRDNGTLLPALARGRHWLQRPPNLQNHRRAFPSLGPMFLWVCLWFR